MKRTAKLSRKEKASINAFFAQNGDSFPSPDKIRARVEQVYSAMRKRGINPQKRMQEIGQQSRWDRKNPYGDYNIPVLENSLLGGFKGCVLTNLMSWFKYEFDAESNLQATQSRLLPAIQLKRVMEQDRVVNFFVQCIISAAEKVNKKGLQQPFYDILKD